MCISAYNLAVAHFLSLSPPLHLPSSLALPLLHCLEEAIFQEFYNCNKVSSVRQPE